MTDRPQDLVTPGAYQTARPGTIAGSAARDLPTLGGRLDVLADGPGSVAGMPPNATNAWRLVTLAPSRSCGVFAPNLRGSGPGEVLINLQDALVWGLAGLAWRGPGSPAVFPVSVRCDRAFHRAELRTQGVFTFGSQTVLTDAVDLVFGS